MLRVLVVDDNAMFRDVFCCGLAHQPGIEVAAQAASLAEARGNLEGIDVVIIDRGLPDGDGLELVGELRGASPGAKVLVMSAFVDLANQQDALEAGADWALGKVEAPYEVFAAIRRLRSEQYTAIHPTT